MDTVLKKLQSGDNKDPKESSSSNRKLTSQEASLIKSLDSATTEHGKAIEDIKERLDRIEEHLLDPELLEKAYKRGLTEHCKRTEQVLKVLKSNSQKNLPKRDQKDKKCRSN